MLAGVTETLGGIWGFLDEGNEGSGKVFCSLAAERPKTISSNFLRFFSLPTTGSSMLQLFFFINLFKVSSNLPPPPTLLAIEGNAELRAACMLEVLRVEAKEDDDDFFELIEKSCTSLKSMAPAEADFISSAIFILGKLDDKSIAPPIEEGGGVLSGGTAGLLNCPDVCRDSGACWWAGGGCRELLPPAGEAADEERLDDVVVTPVEAAAAAAVIFAISVSQSLGANV